MSANTSDPFIDSHDVLLEDIKYGRLIPVLGGDINLCGRPRKADGSCVGWKETDVKYPPTSAELALYLLTEAIKQDSQDKNADFLRDIQYSSSCHQVEKNPERCPVIGLANVCQYLQVFKRNFLRATLPRVLETRYAPTPVHDFLVDFARIKPDPSSRYDPPYPLIVTACFDSVLEQQLDAIQQPYHLVAFVGDDQGGSFEYTPPGGEPIAIQEVKTETLEKELRSQPVILKLNGGVGRDYAITEDHFIDYLTHRKVKEALPDMLFAKLTKKGTRDGSNLMFLGYSPKNWNLRVILRRIWSESLSTSNKRWTVIQERIDSVDKGFWKEYGLDLENDLLDIDSLESYIKGLTIRLRDDMSAGSRDDSKCVDTTRIEGARPSISPPLDTGPHTSTRENIFFSYSHKDKKWLDQMKTMLAPIKARLNAWDDSHIKPGDKWQDEIQKALSSARAAVLLVSPSFLESEFIQNNELPDLLKAAESEGCKILWINVSKSLVKLTKLNAYQALHADPPLSSLEGNTDSVLADICEKLATACDITASGT